MVLSLTSPLLKWNECCGFILYPQLYSSSGLWGSNSWASAEGWMWWVGQPGTLRGGWLWDANRVGSRMIPAGEQTPCWNQGMVAPSPSAWHPTSASPHLQHLSVPCQGLLLHCPALTSQLGLQKAEPHLILVAARRGGLRYLSVAPALVLGTGSACCWTLVLVSIWYHTVHEV